MKLRFFSFVSIFLCFGSTAVRVSAQDAASLYGKWCAVCHEATAESRAPGRDVLSQMTAEQILAALETGPMAPQAQGAMISRAERRALAEYLSGKAFGSAPVNPIPQSAFCAASANKLQDSLSGPLWNGWGVTITNTRFQPASDAGLTAADVPQLKLKWAFGFPGATSASSQPVMADDRVYAGSWEGDFFSLDAKTGCIHWAMQAESGVRSAATIGKAKDGRLTLYFGDLAANLYALDAATGKQLWKVRVDEYPAARITGSPVLYDGKLYVPVSSREESRVGRRILPAADSAAASWLSMQPAANKCGRPTRSSRKRNPRKRIEAERSCRARPALRYGPRRRSTSSAIPFISAPAMTTPPRRPACRIRSLRWT